MNRPEADDEVELDSGGCGEKVPDSTQRIRGSGDSTSASEQGKRSEASANVPKITIPATGQKTTESMGEIAQSSSDVSSDNNSLSAIDTCENVTKNTDVKVVNINEGLKSFCDTYKALSPDTASLKSEESGDIVLKWDDEDDEESNSKGKNEESDSVAVPAVSEPCKNQIAAIKPISSKPKDLRETDNQSTQSVQASTADSDEINESALSDFTETDTNISRKDTDTSMTETAEVTDISKSSNDLKYESGESSMLLDAEEKDVSVDCVIANLAQIIDEPVGNVETLTSGEVNENPAPNSANEKFNIHTKKDKNEPAEVKKLLDESVTNADEILDAQVTANSTFLDSETGEPLDTSMSLSDSANIEPRKHNLKEPNMMLEIPTQELIDCADDSGNIFTGSSMSIDNSEIEVSNPEKCEDFASLKGGSSKIVSIAAQIESEKDTPTELESEKDTVIQLESEKDNAIEVEPEKTTTTETESGKSTDTETESEKATVILSKMKKIADIHEFNIKDDLGNGDSPLEGHSSDEVDKAIEEPVPNIEMISKDSLGSEKKSLDSKMELTKETSETEAIPNLRSAPNEIEDTNVELPTVLQVPGPIMDSNDLQMALDTSDEVPEVTDSLGLLAESFRVMEDDEEQETSEHDDGDDDDDDDVDADDDNSNQMTVENSEDSNAQHSETDMPKELEPIPSVMDSNQDSALIPEAAVIQEEELTTPAETPEVENEEFTFVLTNITSGVVEEKGNLESVIGEDKQQEPEDSAIKPIIEAEESLNQTSTLEDISAIDTVESVKEATNEPMETESTVDIAMETVKTKGETSDVPDPLLKQLLLQKKDADPSPSNPKQLKIKPNEVVLSIVDLGDSSSEEDLHEVPMTEKPKSDVATDDVTDAAVNDVTATDVATSVATSADDVTAAVDVPVGDIVADVTAVDDVAAGDVVAAADDVTVADDAGDDVTVVECDDVTTVNIPKQIEVMAMGSSPSQIVSGQGATVVSGVPRPHGQRTRFRLNTSELTIKPSASAVELTPLVIPEAKTSPEKGESMDPEQILNISSDEEESAPASAPAKDTAKPKPRRYSRCVNPDCASGRSAPTAAAPRALAAYYGAQRRRPAVCLKCAEKARDREQNLITGIRTSAPLLSLEARLERPDLVEISDSEDSGDEEPPEPVKEELIGPEGAKFLEENLATMLNEAWVKYNLDERLQDSQRELDEELERLKAASAELDGLVLACQRGLDGVRGSLYAAFEPRVETVPALAIVDTPDEQFVCSETMQTTQYTMELKVTSEPHECKRRREASEDSAPNKKLATQSLKLPETLKQEPKPADTKPNISKLDDDKDVSVVRLSAESAPADLPPAAGEPSRPPLAPGLPVLAMRNAFGSWMRGRVVEVTSKSALPGSQFTHCRVKFDSKSHKNQYKQLPARCLAYNEPPDVRMTIGTRLVALFKDPMNPAKRASFYSGIVAEVPNPVNSYRYLVFFDDGYAQYIRHANTRLVCECSPLVWEEVHPFSREFVKQYLRSYPERPMVRLHTGQSIKTEWNGLWWFSKVTKVDASLVQVHFEKDNRREWIYRGSTRLAPLFLELQAAGKHRARPLPRNRLQNKSNMPYVEYTRSDEPKAATAHSQQEEARRQRAVAKKSVTLPVIPPAPPTHLSHDSPSRVVYYTPKNAVRPHKMAPHPCGPRCKREDVLALQDLRTYNPLAKPLLSGWERQIVRFKFIKNVMYRAPCGRRIRNIRELHRYLRLTQSDMGVDLFDFAPTTHCLAEFVLNKCVIAKKDLSNGKENVPVPCVNYYDQSLPEFCSYNTERTPTEGVPLNLDPEFLCGCDCQDDCMDKSKCACWQLTLAGARTIGMRGRAVGYSYKRLKEPLPSGIYECNSRCKCKSTCLNRVAQHPLQLKLQVFKTLNRGWGIRALNDVPRGAFLCVYAGNLLTDATANLDGLNEGDEYLAELDYIEVVEQMKEGYENDIPEADKKLDRKESGRRPGESTEEEDLSSSEDEEHPSKNDDDCDFEPGYSVPVATPQFSKRLRKREMKDREDAKASPAAVEKKDSTDNDCITISDDEEVREPSSFSAQLAMGDGKFISKYKSVRSLYGEDEACYIMDAKVQGNIGRYLNHSCAPNVFVQNVFVDTHDPRFPWVAFFALLPIKAGTELTWNYNYDIGSVPGKTLYCYCGAQKCRGRLL